MPVTLYHFPASPPSRIALAAAKVVGVDVDVKIVNLFAGEHLKEEFVKFPVLFLGKTSVEDSVKASAYEAIGFLEKFLEPSGWVAGDHLTIADVACAVTATSMQAIGLDFSGYPKTKDWIERCKKIPGFQEANEEGAEIFGERVRSRLPPNHLAP
uniref:Epsilon glutathione S-transferase n=1 Tax=Locusta migratoria TaxID=7004 RepID=V9Q2P4_LOCMI|nr:epsilon glutathione S-transferase [Locusta migratoria]